MPPLARAEAALKQSGGREPVRGVAFLPLCLGFIGGVIILPLLAMAPALAGKACYFEDAEGSCIDKSDVEPIHLLRKGSPYTQARTQLLRLGYRPGRIPGNDKARCADDPCTPVEMLSCGGKDGFQCRFLLEKGDSHYLVHTRGRDYRYVGASFMSDQEHARVMAQPAD